MSYYAIYIPKHIEGETEEDSCVFTEIEEALKVLKNHKDARLKVFKNSQEAVKYAQTGYEACPSKLTDLKSPSAVSEKAIFKAPTKQELAIFKKLIEGNKIELVRDTIWENPRYLVNSGDTPTYLKEGPRYNALHVCAINGRAEIAELILETISDVEFVKFLHGKENDQVCKEVSEILLDYYLNMPEKGRSETPLHLAAKYGAVNVVEILTSYPQCKMTLNSDNKLAKDIVCSRANQSTNSDVKEKISILLEERFYVPVIRSEDNSTPPFIGEPFSPTSPPCLNKDPMSPKLEIQACAGPMSKDQAETFRRRWKTPPRTGSSLNSTINNASYLSPVKTPSSTPTMSLNNNSVKKLKSSRRLDLTMEDNENGNNVPAAVATEEASTNEIELINNNSNTPPSHFPFPTPIRRNPSKRDLFFTYRDKTSSPVVIEDHLSYSSNGTESIGDSEFDSPGLKERHLKLSDTEKGLELIGRELAKEQKVEWKEYWDFLGCFIDISSSTGLTKLEEFLQSRQNTEKSKSKKNKRKLSNFSGHKKIHDDQMISNLCNAFRYKLNTMSPGDKVDTSNDKTSKRMIEQIQVENNTRMNANNIISNAHSTAPHLCIERALQVFATRMMKTITHNIESVISINDSLISELKRLKSLICSFKGDPRFSIVDFSVTHSRFANLIATYLEISDIKVDKLVKIEHCLEQILKTKPKIPTTPTLTSNMAQKEELFCVLHFIINNLKTSDVKPLPENINTQQICLEIWQKEKKCNCAWESHQDHIVNREMRRMARETQLDSSEPTTTLNKFVYEKFLNSRQKILDGSADGDKVKTISDDDSTDTSDTEDGDADEEEDIFWSDIGSDVDEDKFYTPPESPSGLEIEELFDCSTKPYSAYLFGNKPTKRDMDVINALNKVEIDKNTYPHIHLWRTAVISRSKYESFQSPTSVRKFNANNQKESKPNMTTTRRLFATPTKFSQEKQEFSFSLKTRNYNGNKFSESKKTWKKEESKSSSLVLWG